MRSVGGHPVRLLDRILDELHPRPVTSDELLYEHMPSQSFRSLPILYVPFNPDDRSHWADRGAVLDFAAVIGGGHILDFGPGDGWPSLLVAPFVRGVVGVDASRRRVAVCRANARRLGIANAQFVHVPAGAALPFSDASFDGATAASSIEQSPNPQAVLRELYRVLRPGGRLRIYYEALHRYRGGRERELYVWAPSERVTHVVLYDRQIERETVVHLGLRLQAPSEEVLHMLLSGTRSGALTIPASGTTLPADLLTEEGWKRIRGLVAEAVTCTLVQPGCRTLCRWLAEVGFHGVTATHGGRTFAARVFDELSPASRPRTLPDIDAFLGPAVRAVVRMEAPEHLQAPITAIK
ncbi:MAG: class I SAM-dependent methyltransferase [Limnochordaceae bacterium]|nr:class I SAM-dependent methyltransferase [Limnochordaceae bacterium]